MQIKDGITILLDSATLQLIFDETGAENIKRILEDKIKNRKADKFAEQFSIKQQDEIVAFACDRRKCKKCSFPSCKHTFDIKHAQNFKKGISGIFEET